MPSPAILDFEPLLAPIPGGNPAGVPLSPELRKRLDDKRKDIDPNKFAANDPRRPEQAQPADWAGVFELAQESLAKTSKDLLLAVRVVEALVKLHGFAGLRDGLRLLRRLVAECWDRVHPVIEDGDLEVRAAGFNWLDDEIKGARFPYTVRTIPMTRTGDGADYGWQSWRDAQEVRAGKTQNMAQPPSAVTPEMFEKAVAATPREFYQLTSEDLGASVEELTALTKLLNEKMGKAAAPGLVQVNRAASDCLELAQMILKRKGPAPAPVAAFAPVPVQDGASPVNGSASAAQPAPTAQPAPAPRPPSRDDLLNQLADASAMLLQMEPHSPIAYMVQRAVKLARLPLPELMRVLVRDQNVLGQLDRDLDLGIDKQDAAKADAAKAAKK
jgi:type VI secretion system protein ImpA